MQQKGFGTLQECLTCDRSACVQINLHKARVKEHLLGTFYMMRH